MSTEIKYSCHFESNYEDFEVSHGGKRNGAGRPKGGGRYGETTKPIRLPVSLISTVLKFIKNKGYQLPLYSSKVSAGSPGQANDDIECHLDLNDHLIKHPAETFFVRATGLSMIGAGIHENDILIVDRRMSPKHGKIVIAAVDGQLTVKRLSKKDNQLLLMPENKDFQPIEITEASEVYIWGVVTNVIHAV